MFGRLAIQPFTLFKPKQLIRYLSSSQDWHGTTILCVRKNNKVCMIGDGMISMGSLIVKPNAKKIRKIIPKKNPPGKDAIVGFAGTTADAFTLLERLEGKMVEYPGQLERSCVELAKGWRMDKYLRRLEASLIVADENTSLQITGNGDVLESHDNIISVGSGSPYAIAAARALIDQPDLDAEQIARKFLVMMTFSFHKIYYYAFFLQENPWKLPLKCVFIQILIF